MTDKEKAKAYDEALERARKQKYDYQKELDKTDKSSQLAGILRAGISAIESASPELVESEDERIRKEIVDYLNLVGKGDGDYAQPMIDKWIAYLEKQKESLHIHETCKENANSFTDADEDRTINGCLLAANAERRCKRASEELLEELGLADYTKFFYEQGVEKGKKERDKQKEQKPAEYLPKEKVYNIMTKLTDLSSSQLIPINSPEYLKIHDITRDVRSLLDYPIEQKPAEWSDEDEKIRKTLLDYYGKALDNYTCVEWLNGITYGELCDWLKDLPERFNLQPKQELDEDTAQWVECIIKDYEQKLVEEPNHAATIQAKITVLKSLRPQSKENPKCEDCPNRGNTHQYLKGSKEGNRELALSFMAYLDEHRPEGKMCLSNGECADIEKVFIEHDWDKIMRYANKYQSHWKPSEEQMKALYCALNDAISLYSDKVSPLYEEISRTHFDALESLYNDLKKLI